MIFDWLETVLDATGTVLLIVGTIGGLAFTERRRRRRAPTLAGTSVLLTYYTEGANMVPLKHGKIGDMHYSAMAVTGIPGSLAVDTRPALIYRIELPFNTSLHLVGVPKEKGVVQLDPGSGGLMEEVDLEGDYGRYFNLFCQKGMQTQARYVLDPKAMIFTIDFCRSHNWEILGHELYFIQATANVAGDSTTMQEDVEQFIKEIRPALAKPLTEKELRLRTPYGHDRRRSLACPICASDMSNEQDYFKCPQQHGILLQGANLSKLRDKKIIVPDFEIRSATPRTQALSCPSCGSIMEQVSYNGSLTVIDSCPDCPYRWLDSGEVATHI